MAFVCEAKDSAIWSKNPEFFDKKLCRLSQENGQGYTKKQYNQQQSFKNIIISQFRACCLPHRRAVHNSCNVIWMTSHTVTTARMSHHPQFLCAICWSVNMWCGLFPDILYISLLHTFDKIKCKLGNVHINVISRRVRVTISAVKKQYVLNIINMCFSLKLSSMHHIIFSYLSCLAVLYFSTLFFKRKDLRGKSCWTYNVCFDFHYKFCLKYFSFQE